MTAVRADERVGGVCVRSLRHRLTRGCLHTQAMQAHRGVWRDCRVGVPAVAVLATCAALLPTAGGFAPRVVAAPFFAARAHADVRAAS